MDRRGFLKLMGLGAVAAASELLLPKAAEAWSDRDYGQDGGPATVREQYAYAQRHILPYLREMGIPNRTFETRDENGYDLLVVDTLIPVRRRNSSERETLRIALSHEGIGAFGDELGLNAFDQARGISNVMRFVERYHHENLEQLQRYGRDRTGRPVRPLRYDQRDYREFHHELPPPRHREPERGEIRLNLREAFDRYRRRGPD